MNSEPSSARNTLPPLTEMSADRLAGRAEEDDRLVPILRLARACNYPAGHTHQVTHLALRLFDELQGLHGRGPEARYWLQAGSLLHDIGWVEGWKSHHKTGLRIIMTTPMLPWNGRERLIIGSITRYHRKSLPHLRHDNYAALNPGDRETVAILASLLRLADGLDRSHQSLVSEIKCQVGENEIAIVCTVRQPAPEEMTAAQEKSDLLQKIYKKKIEITWSVT